MAKWFHNGPFNHESDIFIRVERKDGEVFDVANLSCSETVDPQATADFIVNALNHYSAYLKEELKDDAEYQKFLEEAKVKS